MPAETTEHPNLGPTEQEVLSSHLEDAEKYFADRGGSTRAKAPVDEPEKKEDVAEEITEITQDEDLGSSIFGQKKKDETKPEEKKETVVEDPLDKLVAPDAKSKHRADWDKMKDAAKTAQAAADVAAKKVTELETRLKGSPDPAADAATKARLTELETQNKDLSDRLKIFDLQGHPEFQKEFVAPKNAAIAAVQEILKTDEVSADLQSLLALKGKAFNTEASKIMEKLSPMMQGPFVQELLKIQRIDQAASATILNADAFRDQKTKEFQARTRKTFDTVAVSHASLFVPAQIKTDATPEQKANDEAWNKALSERNSAAERYAFSQQTDAQVADMAQKAASYDLLVANGIPRIAKVANTKIATLTQKVKDLEAELGRTTKSKPRVTVTAETRPEGDKDIGELSHRDAARSIVFPTRTSRRS